MAHSDIQVTFEFGHKSIIKSKTTPEGFTHDWEVYVRGADGADISHFVEKVVFYLHATFQKPKRVIKEPPFSVKESGYAGFNLLIDIYFKTKDEPKKFKHSYDLDLQTSGPMVVRSRREKYIFTNPSGDFRKKLIRGGGVSDHLVGIDAPSSDKAFGDPLSKSQKPSSSSHAKPLAEAVKKHKKEPEFKPTTQFSELFGDPIKKAPETKKHTPTPSTSKPSTSSSGGKGPNSKAGASGLEKISISDKKLSAPKEDKREEKKRDKSSKESGSEKKSAAKPSSPVTLVKVREEVKVKEDPSEKKKKEKKQKEEKDSKSKYQQADKSSIDKLIKEKEMKKSPKLTSGLSLLEEKMRHKDSGVDKQHKSKHKKKDKEKKEKKSESKDKKRESKTKEEVIKFKEPEPHSPSPPAPVKRKLEKPPPQREKLAKTTLLDEIFDNNGGSCSSSSSSSSSDDDDIDEPVKRIKLEAPSPKQDASALKKTRDEEKKKGRRNEEKPPQRKRKHSSDSDSSSSGSPPSKKGSPPGIQDMLPPPLPVNNVRDMTPEYESELRELQRKIMNLDDDEELQRLVDVITATGKYELTKKTFDFDLCTLDRNTVTRLQDFFRAL
ncbi:protein AF-9 isoform X1 [Cloeon dipterum]|uniref:protein AF-9 isoform X1 n=1 Tax=Cloeon dipterum TaxID=197152 RepID=UPI00322093CE